VTLNLPAGILFQPHERIAITARIGYTLVHGASSSGNSSFSSNAHYLPLGADIVATLLPQLDIGFAFYFLGPLSTSLTSNRMTTPPTIPARNYADGRIFSIFIDGRF